MCAGLPPPRPPPPRPLGPSRCVRAADLSRCVQLYLRVYVWALLFRLHYDKHAIYRWYIPTGPRTCAVRCALWCQVNINTEMLLLLFMAADSAWNLSVILYITIIMNQSIIVLLMYKGCFVSTYGKGLVHHAVLVEVAELKHYRVLNGVSGARRASSFASSRCVPGRIPFYLVTWYIFISITFPRCYVRYSNCWYNFFYINIDTL